MMEESRGKRKEEPPYDYFSSPDGEDVDRKLWAVAKPATLTGLFLATCDVILISRPQGYMKTLGRYAYITLPIMGMAATFVMVSNIAGSVRKRNDSVNWVLGGLASGGVVGSWQKSTGRGLLWGTGLALTGMLLKYSDVHNIQLLKPNKERSFGSFKWVNHDYSLMKETPGWWKRE